MSAHMFGQPYFPFRLPTGKNLKTYNRDALFGTSVKAFIPYMEQLVPNFTKNVLLDEGFMTSLTREEQNSCQQLVDMIIKNYTFMFGLSRNKTTLASLLFITNRVPFELIDFKVSLLSFLDDTVKKENVLEYMEVLEEYMERDKDFKGGCKIIDFFFEHCLELVAVNSDCDLFDIEKEPRIEKCLKKIYRIKKMKPVKWQETRLPLAQKTDLCDLYDKPSGDIEVKIGTKTVKCHKTILSSASEFFETQFESSEWNCDVYETDHLDDIVTNVEIFEVVLKFAYGIFKPESIEPSESISLIKVAHLYRMKDLIDASVQILSKDKSTYFSVLENFSLYLDDPIFDIVTGFLLGVGINNTKAIFESSEEEIAKIPHHILVKLCKSCFAKLKK